MKKNIAVAISLGALTLALSLVLHVGGLGVLPPRALRNLAQAVVLNTYNPWNETLTSYSLNAVAAVIWDYRGIDTIFETAVLFAAVTGVAALFQGAVEKVELRRRGMPFMLKTSTKIALLLIALVSISLAFHGHLTPGGGFQAGSVFAVITALGITVFSIEALYSAGLRIKNLMRVRLMALALILSIALLPLTTLLAINGIAYIAQNQVKEDSSFAMPAAFFNTPLAGSVFFFNVIEFIAVAAALSYILMFFAMRREELEHVLRGCRK
ncbi:MAG: MnhB domain-containing protein [Desulfurococcaceae archaeon]